MSMVLTLRDRWVRARNRTALPVRTETRRRFVTPEGVDLRLEPGAYVDRLIALMIDGAILLGSLTALTLLAFFAAWRTKSQVPGEAVAILWTLGSFVLRVGYFIGFELGARGATPGKRIMHLRVIARDGRALSADAIFTRNALRELEVFLPAMFLLARGQGVDGVLIALGGIWTGVLALFPLFNPARLRMGDIAAGTLVVRTPRPRLLRDIADTADTRVGGVGFTDAQLDAYGIEELKVLEQVLRAGDRRTMAAVAARIRARIQWEGPVDSPDRSFLSAYYAALRQRLEAGLLFGRARRNKSDGGQAKT